MQDELKTLEISMGFLSTRIKHLSIAVGLYRPARRIARIIRPREQRELREDAEFYRSLLRPRSLCFDIGANVGDKSEAMLRIGARVVAFEPNRLVVPELRARCGVYEHWTLVETALGGGPGIAVLHAQESHSQSSFANDWEGGKVIASFAVPVVTLDAAIECFGVPRYCKIDVEGWELEVLKGLTQPIDLISFEFHLNDRGIRNTRSCLERLRGFGPYRLNVTPADTSAFHFKEWIALEQFVEQFPENLVQSLPGKPYGDIFLKSLTQ